MAVHNLAIQHNNGFLDLPPNCSTLVELLQSRAIHQSSQRAFTFLQDGEVASASFTYQELDEYSRTIATHLQAKGLTGERALLLYPPGLDYLAAFFGCLYAGVIAVPAYPPRNQRNTPRILAIANDAQATIALTTTGTLTRIQSLLMAETSLKPMQWLTTDDLTQPATDWQLPAITSDSLAFLQYTSGSTGTPKGVMLSHGNLLHNAAATYQLMEHSPASIFVSWLPAYHDMGLIGGILQPLYGGFPCYLMAPALFLQSPYRWLKAITDYRGTTSGGPNFAYELCLQKITPEQRETLDLSSWSVAFNGAEPIRAETLERFSQHFAVCGFRPDAFYPCYGMAETTLMVSGGRKAALPNIKRIQKTALENNRIEDANDNKLLSDIDCQNTQVLVGCGQTLPDQRIAIVHPDTLIPCRSNEIGEVWVSGPSVGHGYWNRPEDTEQTFHAYLSSTGEGPFLRTGDLGFLQNDELFITGRAKDLIIIRGRNLYPQDIELTTERSHAALRSGSGAAFSVEVGTEEQLVIVQEIEFRQKPDFEAVIAAIRQSLAETHKVQAYAVVLIKPGSLPKTSSGKIQRRLCRTTFLAGELAIVSQSILNAQAELEDENKLSRATLLATAPEYREVSLTAYLQNTVARSLHIAPSYINPHQPISSLGLDSLKIFELKNRLERDLDISVSIADWFEGVSLTQLAQTIAPLIEPTHERSHADTALSQIGRPSIPEAILKSITENKIEYPLSFAQQRLWLVHQYIPHSSAYHIALAIHLIGNLDCSSLEQSLNVLIQRHDCLRTSISVVDGNPVQVIQAIAPMHLPILEHPSSPDCQSLSNSWLEDAQTPFDLSQAPLWRTKLLRLTATHAILLLTLHHIIADGWSIGVLLQELKELYQAFSTGRSPVLPPLAIQYAAFSEWQRQWLQGEILDTQLGYWQQQLSGDPPLLNLPIDFPRPAVRSFRGKRQTLILPRSLTERIKHLSQQEGTTLFMTLLTAFKTLLYRYTEQADLWVGVPIANRHQTEVEQLIGCFVNTLILRTDLSGNPTVREVLRRVRRVALDAYTHQDLPFERLVEALQPQRDLSHTPLFQVMFVFQNVPGLILQDESTVGHLPSAQPDCCASEINWQVEEIDTESAKFDLTLFMADRGAELSATLEYNTDLFNANTITRMLGHLQILLEDIAANPDLPISNLSLLTPLERDRLLIDWQQQPCSLPYSTLHQWFEAQVEQTPDAIAVVYQDESLTYRDLNQRANQLAHYLRSIGVKPEVLVGICTERSPAMVVGLFGILKAGGAYVPLDPTYPQERLMFMLRDSQSPVLVTQQRLINTIPSAILDIPQLTLVCLDSDWQMIAHEPSDNPDHTTTADHLAYVIYTSGSTGKPKGAMIQHRGLVNYLNWCIQAYPVQQGTGAPIHSSISFDMTITGLFSPLLVGRAVELLPDGFGVDALSQVLRHKPNFSLVKITPAQLELLSHQVSSQDTTIGTQAFIIGGENLSAQSLAFWQRLSPNTLLVNEYGPTETVVGCCVYPVPHSLPPSGWVPIGRAIANTQLYILDSHLQLVPVGVTGELYIGGMGVARGYLHRPDLTAERFIPNPYSPQTGTRLYKTGDRARYLPDGTIECLGRTDNQVKIRGFRIELGEIEAALNQHPAIQESLVVTREVAAADWRLIAYVVPQSAEATPNLVPLLRDWLKQHLPDYMVPANVVILDAFPLTVNGKIDRQALPVPATIRPELSVAYTSPQTELERSIAHLWQSALGVDTVGIHDNFFDLGGHSLLLVQIHHHLQTLLQQPLSVIELFKYPTIHAIAKHLSQTADPSAQFQQVQDRVKQQKAAISRQQQLMQGGRKTHG